MSELLRFCSWNIQVGMQRAQILELVASHPDFRALDLITLQEASVHDHGDDASEIAHVLGITYTSYHHVYHHLGTRPQANAFVWNSARVQMDTIDHHTLPPHMHVHVPRAERVILNRLKSQPRVNLIGDGKWQNLSLRVCAAHLDVLGYRFKQRQFRAVLDEMKMRPRTDLTLLAGDFNTFRVGSRPTWAQLQRDAAELDLRAISNEIRWTQSIRALRLKQKLDEIFFGTALPYRTRVWTLDVNGSDHLPIFADITLL